MKNKEDQMWTVDELLTAFDTVIDRLQLVEDADPTPYAIYNADSTVRQASSSPHRGLDDRTRASLRVQSTCRATLAEEVGQHAVDELIVLKTKVAPSSDFIEKLNSLFGLVKKTDVAVIQPLCAAAYEDSHVPTANDPPRLRRNGQVVAAA
ncbi:unnamed protein product [Cylicocyclus nassatus]|uniref:Uncharacterized protein n=1 Tax=Cylicocyclus nassatus TaxID=53992 RepID=A0AA36GDM1_CYLNA|nr:unnamed protein product [Cylicocyclus nassatus]